MLCSGIAYGVQRHHVSRASQINFWGEQLNIQGTMSFKAMSKYLCIPWTTRQTLPVISRHINIVMREFWTKLHTASTMSEALDSFSDLTAADWLSPSSRGNCLVHGGTCVVPLFLHLRHKPSCTSAGSQRHQFAGTAQTHGNEWHCYDGNWRAVADRQAHSSSSRLPSLSFQFPCPRSEEKMRPICWPAGSWPSVSRPPGGYIH